MMPTETGIKKVRIKFSSKGARAEAGADSCRTGSMISETRSKMGLPETYCSRKRERETTLDGGVEKRQKKMELSLKQQCLVLLKSLMQHRNGWAFNMPVDPVKHEVPDYFNVIKKPMDLGTVKSKLAEDVYFDVEEFAADVRLTFSNAMLYNPPSNAFHRMAKVLNHLFDLRWKSLKSKLKTESQSAEAGRCISNKPGDDSQDTDHTFLKKTPLSVSSMHNKTMSSEEKHRLWKELLQISRENLSVKLRNVLKKLGLLCIAEEDFEVIDTLDENTLLELKRVVQGYLDARAAKVEPQRTTQNGRHTLLKKTSHTGPCGGSKTAGGSANTRPPSSMGSVKTKTSRGQACSEDSLSDQSHRQDHSAVNRTERMETKLSTSYKSRPDPHSNGSVNVLNGEFTCLNSGHSDPAATAACTEGWTPPFDVELSPSKARRAMMLKNRFADTILKAQQMISEQSLNIQGNKADPLRLQRERERLEKQNRQAEHARIEAEVKAAAKMRETEAKMQREREREAARLTLDKMEKTVDIEDNVKLLRDFEGLCRCCPYDHLRCCGGRSDVIFGKVQSGHQLMKPLEQLGLYIKEDPENEEATLDWDCEEGEIFS